MKSTLIVILFGVLLAVALPRASLASNGIVEYEIPYTEVDYVHCIGEDVEFDVTITVRTHLIETPSGGLHYAEHWLIEGTALGLNSGLTWYGHGASPYTVNANGSQLAEGWVLAVMYEPLDGGRKFRKSWPFRIAYDANGIARVEHLEPYRFRCIGK